MIIYDRFSLIKMPWVGLEPITAEFHVRKGNMSQELIPSFGGSEKPWKTLFALATTGVSTAQELFQYKGHYDPLTFLCAGGWVEKELVQIYGKAKILLVKLTPLGVDFCREKGWKVVEPEWAFLSRLHPSETGSQKHTAAVLWFAGIARYFEWEVELLSRGIDPFLKPDLLEIKDGLTDQLPDRLKLHHLMVDLHVLPNVTL